MLTVNRLPADYVWANEYDAEAVAYGNYRYDAIYVRRDFDQVDVAVPANVPLPCVREFGEHDECTGDGDCPALETLWMMNAPYPDETDYSGWYGGEQGYQDGLRWSDFV